MSGTYLGKSDEKLIMFTLSKDGIVIVFIWFAFSLSWSKGMKP